MPIVANIQKFFLAKKNSWLVTSIVLLFILLFLQSTRNCIKYEGFEQTEPFTVQRGNNAYDDFYSEIYDRLYKSDSRSEEQAMRIINSTQPDKEFSHFLDVGCGTGCLVEELKKRGFNAVGIDKSSAMIETGKDRNSNAKSSIKCGDAADPMLFERGIFTHVLCMERTVYEIPDKIAFFRNCKHWLQPGGYFLIHLVDPERFNTIAPLGRPRNIIQDANELKTSDGKRVTDSTIDFLDFKYKSTYDFSQYAKTGKVVQIEKFTDSASDKVRQNEHTFYMAPQRTILEDLRYCGFLLTGEWAGNHEKVYILKSL